ncbi:MAG: DUF692 domain-containing protein [Pirellula sp.]
MEWSKLPQLGVGIGFREPFLSELFGCRRSIDFLEITADHYFEPIDSKAAELELLAGNFPLIPHGLAMSLGSAEGLDAVYLKRYADLVQRLKPAWCSEHISFTRAGGIDIGHLTPLPKTDAVLSVLHDNIARLQDTSQTPLILENITDTIRYPTEKYDGADFLCRLCEHNEIGLLLDVTNLFINSQNQRFDPIEFLHRLPADRIVQLHFVGSHIEEGIWVDSHSKATQSEIWELLEQVVRFAPVKGMILERDENIPNLRELIPELEHAKSIVQRVRAAQRT